MQFALANIAEGFFSPKIPYMRAWLQSSFLRRGFSTARSSSASSNFVKNGLVQLEKQAIQVGGCEIYAPLLQWCGNAKAIFEGRRVHDHLLRNGYGSNTFLGNCLIQMYRKCGCLEEARAVFDAMGRRDVVSWNKMICAYAQNGQSKAALDLYQRMDSEGLEPDRVTFVGILGACGNLQALEEGRGVHRRIQACKRDSDVVLETALLTMYAKCGSLQEARDVFDTISRKNVISWTAMITAYTQAGHAREAVELYETMGRGGVEPNRVTFIGALGAYSTLGDLRAGQEVHARIAALGIEVDGSLGNALISMYSRCGRIDQARKVFDQMCHKDVVSWTSMITAYTQNIMANEALNLYKIMDLEPNSITYITVLTACSVLGALEDGRKIHARLGSLSFQPDRALETALISMYGNCGSLEEARNVFDEMKERNVMSWNAMLGAYANFGRTEALKFFQTMELEGAQPDLVTFVCVLGSCASLGSLEQGRAIHERVVAMNLLPDSVLETALVNMYAKCHRLQDARRAFDNMRQKDVVSWTAMIAAYAQEGCTAEALNLYKRIDGERIEPNDITFVAVLGACFTPDALEDGRAVHERIIRSGMLTDLVQNALLNMYTKCGSLEEASKVFEAMEKRTFVTYNTMLTGLAQDGRPKEVLALYKRMEAQGVEPDQTTLVTVLGACSNLGKLAEGKLIYASCKRMEHMNGIVVDNAIVNLHAKCGFLDDGRQIFERMQVKNLVSWTAMIVGYAQHGHGKEALGMYQGMLLDGAEPDYITFITIFIACSHAGLVFDGRQCFVSMAADCGIQPLVEHYLCMVDLLGRAGWLNEAEELIHNMPFQPQAFAWMTLLGSCKIHSDFERARRVEELVMELNPDEDGSHILLHNIYMSMS